MLAAGIILAVACVLSASFAALNLHGYYHLLDGSAEHYKRLHKRAVIFFTAAAVLLIISVACFIFRVVI